MNLLQSLLYSRFAVALGLGISQAAPPWLGYRIADLGAALVASRTRSAIVRAICVNQWVIRGENLTRQAMRQIVREVLRTHARNLYVYFHTLNRPQEVLERVTFSPEFQDLFDHLLHEGGPAFFVTPHLSNFDLAGRALALRGLRFQVLSYPQPPGAYRWQNRLRRDSGIEVTPISMSALQQARARLQQGGVVLTGIDRPLNETRYFPRFFGRPAPLPVFHVRLALQLNLPIIVVACIGVGEGHYSVVARPPVIMQPAEDLEQALIQNTEAVLREAEVLIRQVPHQWAMFYPVWPEVATALPF